MNVPNDRYISRWKGFLKKFSLQHFFIPEYYRNKKSNDIKNDWHLHEFTLNGIKIFLSEYFYIHKVHVIPYHLLPFQYLLVLNPKK